VGNGDVPPERRHRVRRKLESPAAWYAAATLSFENPAAWYAAATFRGRGLLGFGGLGFGGEADSGAQPGLYVFKVFAVVEGDVGG
jgi:hypothetical protein